MTVSTTSRHIVFSHLPTRTTRWHHWYKRIFQMTSKIIFSALFATFDEKLTHTRVRALTENGIGYDHNLHRESDSVLRSKRFELEAIGVCALVRTSASLRRSFSSARDKPLASNEGRSSGYSFAFSTYKQYARPNASSGHHSIFMIRTTEKRS